MSNWSSGYSETEYTYGYYPELCPLRATFALTAHGLNAPNITNACELGFGQGISVNVHAAASGINWTGNDFLPAQAAFARGLAAGLSNTPNLTDDSFEELLRRDDIPDFEYIGLHGVWSWVSDENREIITEFIRQKLVPGGIAYLGYNSLPGWSGFAPARHLMVEHANAFSTNISDYREKVAGSINFLKKLSEIDPKYGSAHPEFAQRLSAIEAQDATYLQHEYFNVDWHLAYFSEVAKSLKEAKLDFACSADYVDHIDFLNLTSEQQTFLGSISNREFKETARDFILNTQFRRDYWVKGLRLLSNSEREKALSEYSVVLGRPSEVVELKIKGKLIEADLNHDVYKPLIRALEGFKPVKIGDLRTTLSDLSFAQIIQAVTVLISSGSIFLANPLNIIESRTPDCKSLNSELRRLSVGSGSIKHLSSPVNGGGIPVDRTHQLFLQAIEKGAQEHPQILAEGVWQIFKEQGQKIVKDGEILESDEDNLIELVAIAKDFIALHLPAYRALKVI